MVFCGPGRKPLPVTNLKNNDEENLFVIRRFIFGLRMQTGAAVDFPGRHLRGNHPGA
jgi:hypothetical protein